MQITAEVQAQIDAQNEVKFQQAMARVNLVGGLTNWRKMKSNQKQDKILAGRHKILSTVLRQR